MDKLKAWLFPSTTDTRTTTHALVVRPTWAALQMGLVQRICLTAWKAKVTPLLVPSEGTGANRHCCRPLGRSGGCEGREAWV